MLLRIINQLKHRFLTFYGFFVGFLVFSKEEMPTIKIKKQNDTEKLKTYKIHTFSNNTFSSFIKI